MEKKLGSVFLFPLKVFLVLFFFGLVLGNLGLVFGSLFPLLFVVVSFFLEAPSDFEVRRRLVSDEGGVGVSDEVRVELELRVREGFGFVSLFDDLPDSFELVSGSNFRLVFKGFGEEVVDLSYVVRSPKRGVFELGEAVVGSFHLPPLRDVDRTGVGGVEEVRVRSEKFGLEDIRGEGDFASFPFPRSDVAEIGVSTTDFQEVRAYEFGDPLRRVNWKATARSGGHRPLVNEYEKEGEKVVWFFLDASSDLLVGDVAINGFEYGLRAVDTLTHYFINRGYMVGLYVFNDDGKLIYPERGRSQYIKVVEELLELEASDRDEGLLSAVERCRGFISRYNPLTIVFTDIYSKEEDRFIEGVKKLRSLTVKRRSEEAPIFVFNVESGYLQPGGDYVQDAVKLRKLSKKGIKQRILSLGAEYIEWDPSKERFSKSFLRRGKK